ncbi:hypothetical protein LCGC14_1474040 [marine sediment metagenome]|uniref:Helix-turn-helix domain-containing protein n=1 Tax=marine sediment metagenome TaxID=412755 RepID=A0A0F9LRY8_9ZZZZ
MSSESEESKPLAELASRVISVTEASEIANLSKAWVRRLLQTGTIEGVKVGRNWVTTEKAIRDYLDTDRRPGPKTE